MGSTFEHSKLVDDILIAVGSMSNVRLWKNATGAARAFDNPDRVMSFGLKGSSDLLGIIMGGRFLAIECKTGSAVQSKEQKNFEAMISRFGGIYILARSVKEAVDKVTGAAQGCNSGS